MFDLDGTLADTLADIAAAANHALASLRRPRVGVDQIRLFVGKGIAYLMARALGPGHEDLVGEAQSLFQSYYVAHGLEFVRPYEGVNELIRELKQAGLRLAILSNKPDAAVQQVARHLFSDNDFGAICGHIDAPDAPALKPDPAAALAIAGELNIGPKHWIYVGDTAVDMQTARRAGMFAVGVTWGFRDAAELEAAGAEAMIQTPAELMEYLGAEERRESEES